LAGSQDAFVAEVNSQGNLVYSTYLGSGSDTGSGIAVNSSGDAFVTGSTSSSNFPTTTGALQTALQGTHNGFVTELNPTGNRLVYSTYLGGSGNDTGSGIAVDAAGDAFLTGSTSSSDFPTTTGAFQTALSGTDNAFVAELQAGGATLAYST